MASVASLLSDAFFGGTSGTMRSSSPLGTGSPGSKGRCQTFFMMIFAVHSRWQEIVWSLIQPGQWSPSELCSGISCAT